MDVIQLIADRKIREAMENGEFDNLSNSGKKLDYNEDANLSEELRLYYRLMKNMKIKSARQTLADKAQLLRERLKARRDSMSRK